MGYGGLLKISHGYHMWYGVQNMSKYDINIKVQLLVGSPQRNLAAGGLFSLKYKNYFLLTCINLSPIRIRIKWGVFSICNCVLLDLCKLFNEPSYSCIYLHTMVLVVGRVSWAKIDSQTIYTSSLCLIHCKTGRHLTGFYMFWGWPNFVTKRSGSFVMVVMVIVNLSNLTFNTDHQWTVQLISIFYIFWYTLLDQTNLLYF